MCGAALMTTSTDRTLRLNVAYKSDTGLVRNENQDFALVSMPAELPADKGRLLVVADGMGGHRGGATASRLAANTIKTHYLASDSLEVPDALRMAFEQANATIFHEAQVNPDLRGMGTTTSAVVVRDGKAYVAHVGDSRVYLVRGDEIRQLTDDHSLVASMVREGLLTTREAEVHPRRNVLQRSMGVAETVDVDVLPPMEIAEGDTFILCSDGLHGLVKEPELKEISALPVESAVQEFVKRALERGAPDNVTVVVARVESGEEDAASAPDASKTPTQPIRALHDDTAAKPSRFWRWLFGVLLLAGAVSATMYLLGYRVDTAAAQRWFS